MSHAQPDRHGSTWQLVGIQVRGPGSGCRGLGVALGVRGPYE